MQVTWWELEELLDHFRDEERVHKNAPRYEQLSPTMWLRCALRSEEKSIEYADGYVHKWGEWHSTPWYGIAVSIPAQLTKYTMARLIVSVIDASQPPPDLEWLVLNFTSYKIRIRIQEALVEELKLDPHIARLMGIGLAYISLVSPDPGAEETAQPPNGVDPVQDSTRFLPYLGPHGGFTRLRRCSPTACRVEVHAPSAYDYALPNRRDHAMLIGVLRPVDGRPETVDRLFMGRSKTWQEKDLELQEDALEAPVPTLPFAEVIDEPSNLPSVPVLSEVPGTDPDPTSVGQDPFLSHNRGADHVSGDVRDGRVGSTDPR
jgi:hypothetical protein